MCALSMTVALWYGCSMVAHRVMNAWRAPLGMSCLVGMHTMMGGVDCNDVMAVCMSLTVLELSVSSASSVILSNSILSLLASCACMSNCANHDVDAMESVRSICDPHIAVPSTLIFVPTTLKSTSLDM